MFDFRRLNLRNYFILTYLTFEYKMHQLTELILTKLRFENRKAAKSKKQAFHNQDCLQHPDKAPL